MSRAPRRSIVELQKLYDEYKALEPTHKLSEIEPLIGVNQRTLSQWRKNGRPTSNRKYNAGYTFGKWTLINWAGYTHAICECKDCGKTQTISSTSIGKNLDARCYSCVPYVNKDLVMKLHNEGLNYSDIGNALECNPNTARSIVLESKPDVDVDFELDFTEIGKKLGISATIAQQAFASGMKKIKIKCGDLELEQYLDEDDITFGDEKLLENY